MAFTVGRSKAPLALVGLSYLTLILAPILAPVVTEADARPSTRSYTCTGLKQFINSRGAVVINTKNNRVFDRLVANRSFCDRGNHLDRLTVPTRDGRCRVLICSDRFDNDT